MSQIPLKDEPEGDESIFDSHDDDHNMEVSGYNGQMSQIPLKDEPEGDESISDHHDDDHDMEVSGYNGQYFDSGEVVTQKAVHQCDICSKYFLSYKSLEVHSVLHTDERPFQCQVCHKTFRYKSNLFEHRSIHSGFDAHSCPYCGKTCRLKGNLKKHLMIHVTSKEELEEAWSPFVSNQPRRTAVPDGAVVIRGSESSFTPRPRSRKRKLGFGTSSGIWIERIRRGELFPSTTLQYKMSRLDDIIKSAEESGMMTFEELIENAKYICFERFDCPLCKSLFLSRSECLEHIEVEHPMARDERPLFCETCLKSFADRKSMEQHDSYHKRVELMGREGEIQMEDPEFLLPGANAYADELRYESADQ